MRIYLDSCALNRLTDPANHLRIQEEAEAMEAIFLLIRLGAETWIASSTLEVELGRNPDPISRGAALSFLPLANEFRLPSRTSLKRANALASLGYGDLDALHLAIAEDAKADFLITVDDRFLRQINRRLGNPTIQAANSIK